MRFYNIVISLPSGTPLRQYTSFQNGATLPGALNVELDIPVVPLATPMGSALVRVWGIPLQDIAQAANLNNNLISVYGGMQKGLPLAKPKQSGLLVSGYILQAFGNWIGTDMTLDMIVAAGSPPTLANGIPQPRNFNLEWPAGQPLSTALKQTFDKAYPRVTPQINISANIVPPNDQSGGYASPASFAKFINQKSRDILNNPAGYSGVNILLANNKILAYDSTADNLGKGLIAFEDLIGQPTWIDSPLIQIKTVMRADLQVGNQIELPLAIVTNTAQAQSFVANQRAAFQGTFQITQMRHVGAFRQPDAASWVTVIDAAPLLQAGQAQTLQGVGAYIGVG